MGQAREVMDRITAAVVAGDHEAAGRLYAPDAVADTPDAGRLEGREAVIDWLRTFSRAFSDLSFEMIATTEACLKAGISQAVVGNKIGDISWAIADVAHTAGFSVNTQFGGHGVGRTMHGDPHIPNNGRAGRGERDPEDVERPP